MVDLRSIPDPSETRAERLTRTAAAARELKRLRREHPLAFVKLWAPECRTCPHPVPKVRKASRHHRGMPLDHLDANRFRCPACGKIEIRTSQRQAVALMLQAHLIDVWLLGGNRASKSFSMLLVLALFMLGREDPSVQRFARINGLDISRIQPEPGRVWAIAQTFGAAVEYTRRTLDMFLPAGARRVNWGAQQEARVYGPRGGELVSKAVQQSNSRTSGKDPFEGARIHAAGFEEEPQTWEPVESTGMRLVDFRGPRYFALTAKNGWTHVMRKGLGWKREGLPAPQGVAVYNLHGEDNPHIDPTALLRRLQGLPEAIQRARRFGEITALEGMVHEGFDESVYVVKAFDPPPEWPRFRGIDFGFRNPFSCHWYALDQSDDIVHVYREHYAREMLVEDHGKAIHEAETCPECRPPLDQLDHSENSPWWPFLLGQRPETLKCKACAGTGRADPEPHMSWADPADAEGRATLARLGIVTSMANKSRKACFNALWARMAIDGRGRPHFVIHDSCPEMIREFGQLRWRDTTKDPDKLETIGDDHAHDEAMYVCLGLVLSGYSGMSGPDDPDPETP